MTGDVEPYPAHTLGKRFLDVAVYIAGILGPIMSLPQVILVYVGQDVAGISVISWLGWAILDIPFIIYGFAHKERPIIVTYTLWMMINLSVAIGVIIFG